MKAIFHSKNFDVEVEADNHAHLFSQVLDLQNSGLLETKCGCCSSNNIDMRIRKCEYEEEDKKGKKQVKKAEFYEWVCRNKGCWATLTLHMNNEGKKGNMYKLPYIKKDEKRDYSTGGWVKYVKTNGEQNQQATNGQSSNEGFEF